MTDVANLLADLAARNEAASDPTLAAVRLVRASLDALVLKLGQSIDAKVTGQLAAGLTQLTAGMDTFVLKLETPLPTGTPVTIKAEATLAGQPAVTVTPRPVPSAPTPALPSAIALPLVEPSAPQIAQTRVVLTGSGPDRPAPTVPLPPTHVVTMPATTPAAPSPGPSAAAVPATPVPAPVAVTSPASPTTVPTSPVAAASAPTPAPSQTVAVHAAQSPSEPAAARPIANGAAVLPQAATPQSAPPPQAVPALTNALTETPEAPSLTASSGKPTAPIALEVPRTPPALGQPLYPQRQPAQLAPATTASQDRPVVAAPNSGTIPSAVPRPVASPAPAPAAVAAPASLPPSAAPLAAPQSSSAPTRTPSPAPMPLLQVLLDPVQAAARQITIAPLLAQAAAIVAAPAASSLPRPVIEVLVRLLAGRIDLNRTSPDGTVIRDAAMRAGTIEARPGQQADIRLSLLTLRTALAGLLGGRVDAIAPITPRPAPPIPGDPPRAPNSVPAMPTADLPPEETARQLLGHADGALARTKLLQLASSPPDNRAPATQAAAPELRFEIPMLLGNETGMVQLVVERDARGRRTPRDRGWRMRFAMNFSATGEVGADIALLGRAANVSIWAAEQSTADALEATLPELAPALAAHGLDIAGLRVRRGPPPRRTQAPGQLLDSAT